MQRIDREEKNVRRLTLVFTAMLVILVLGSGVALAAAITGTNGPDTLRGTEEADSIYGIGGQDKIVGKKGPDELYGGGGPDTIIGDEGADEIYGGSGSDILRGDEGNDYINSADNDRPDIVQCGAGDEDRAVADDEDTVLGCEDEDIVF